MLVTLKTKWVNCVVTCVSGVVLRRLVNICEAAPISLFWAPNELNVLPDVRPDWQIDNVFFNRPIMAPTQILVRT